VEIDLQAPSDIFYVFDSENHKFGGGGRMGEVAEQSHRWKRTAIVAIAVAVCSLIASAAVTVPVLFTRMPDHRLIGTWQSDADRTIAGIGEREPMDAKREAALRKLFGKLRVTYTLVTVTMELDSWTKTGRYEVLGKDKCSVVIRDIQDKPSPLDEITDLSTFTVIQFDGPDSYWLTTIDGSREYFKRVR
jgi:hypothetical protein